VSAHALIETLSGLILNLPVRCPGQQHRQTMATELDKILADDTTVVTPAAEVPAAPKVEPKVEPKAPEVNPEVQDKETQLANLNRAIADEQERLRKIRKSQKRAKMGLDDEEDEDDTPQIDLTDPAAKAWDKHIQKRTAPANEELEKAKEERRIFALRQFLTDKPALSKSPERVKEMMEMYDRLKSSTELTSEGITLDLERAYAATHSEELIRAVRQGRVDDARNDAIMSDIAVSRGATSYGDAKPATPKRYSPEEIAQLQKWGMTPEEHAKLVEEQAKSQ
jgi:hypothetical protein